MFFRDIVGQENVKNMLLRTVADARVSHALLFLGVEGCGNLAMAIAYAQYICCTSRNGSDSCGICPSCFKYKMLVHPDLHFFYPVNSTKEVKEHPTSAKFVAKWREAVIGNPYMTVKQWYEFIGIENKVGYMNVLDCNDVIKKLSFKPYESEFTVLIIWHPERIYSTAVPKLLKILEEPPEKTLFILVSNDHDNIIKTILSRTQLVKFDNYSIQPGFTGDTAMRNEYFAPFREWMLKCFNNKMVELSDFTDTIAKTGREKQKMLLSYGLNVLHESLLLRYGQQEMVRTGGAEMDFIKNFSKFVTETNALTMYNEFNTAYRYIERNANPRILFFAMSVNFCRLLRRN